MRAGGSVEITKFDGTDYSIPQGAFTWTADDSFVAQSITFAAKHGTTTFPTVSGSTTAPALGSSTLVFFGTNNATMTLDYIAIIATL